MNDKDHQDIDLAIKQLQKTILKLGDKMSCDKILFALSYNVQTLRGIIIEDIQFHVPAEERDNILRNFTIDGYLNSICVTAVNNRIRSMPTKTITPNNVDKRALRKYITK